MASEEGIGPGKAAPRSGSKAAVGPIGLESLQQVAVDGREVNGEATVMAVNDVRDSEQVAGLPASGGQGGPSILGLPNVARLVVSL